MPPETATSPGSARDRVERLLDRIESVDVHTNAVCTLHPDALAQAIALDAEAGAGRARGPLHGVPVLVKDNVDTHDLATTAGSLALADAPPPSRDAELVRRMRDAGMVVLGKTNLSEWANIRSTRSSSGWSARGGQCRNPYVLDRNPCGSSSGSGAAVSAGLCAAAVGTETDGSIVCPSSATGIVGLKPTLGLVSRSGIIPIAHSQDTAGPMTRTVTDAAILLGAIEGAVPDPHDSATRTCRPPANRDYTPHLKRDGLKGARIGVPRAFYYDKVTPPGEAAARGGLNDAQAAAMADVIEILKREGAIIVDPVVLPSVADPDPANNYLTFPICAGTPQAKGSDATCTIVLKYGMKRDFNAWLRSLGVGAPVKTLTELREFNSLRPSRGTLKYGQSRLDISDEIDLAADRARYEADRAKDIALGGARGIDAALKEHRLDALLFPAGAGADIAARPGYPTVMVPFGLIAHIQTPAFPDAFQARPTPFGVSFAGTACSEPRLLELGYAFEQASKRRVPPSSTP
jgi:amidase